MPRSTICLSMIVKDEAPRIERLLASALSHIDAAAIVDTGSSDETIEIIERFCAEHELPLVIEQREWTDFATARNQALDLAQGRCDYILALDADWTMQVEPGALDELTSPGYLYAIEDPSTGLVHYNERLLRDDPALAWRWIHPVHEQPHSPQHPTFELLAGVRMLVHEVGGQRTERYERDAQLLAAALDADPGDEHALFYLANTRLSLGEADAAAVLYRLLLDLRYRSRLGKERRYFALLRLGEMAASRKEAIMLYEWATRLMGHRQEAAVRTATLLREEGKLVRALAVARRERPVPTDWIAVAPWVYEWGMACERALIAAQLGRMVEAERTCRQLLTVPSLPVEQRAGVEQMLGQILSLR